jgi:hypothetical protein
MKTDGLGVIVAGALASVAMLIGFALGRSGAPTPNDGGAPATSQAAPSPAPDAGCPVECTCRCVTVIEGPDPAPAKRPHEGDEDF